MILRPAFGALTWGIAAVLIAVLAAVTAGATAPPWPQQQATYSADSSIRAGGVQLEGRVHHDRGKERREMTIQGVRQIVILRPDRNRAYLIMPQMNSGFEMDFGAAGFPSPEHYMAGLQPVAEGRETVEGLETTRYRISGTAGDGATMDGHVWVTDDGIIMRMRGTASTQTDTQDILVTLSNVVRAPQDAALFEPPAGLNLMRMDPSMMQNLPRMPGGGN